MDFRMSLCYYKTMFLRNQIMPFVVLISIWRFTDLFPISKMAYRKRRFFFEVRHWNQYFKAFMIIIIMRPLDYIQFIMRAHLCTYIYIYISTLLGIFDQTFISFQNSKFRQKFSWCINVRWRIKDTSWIPHTLEPFCMAMATEAILSIRSTILLK